MATTGLLVGVHPLAMATITLCTPIEEEDSHGTDNDNAKQDHSSRTSLTLSGSWDITAITTVTEQPTGNGIDVPVLLQPLLGMDFLPFAAVPPPPATTSSKSTIREQEEHPCRSCSPESEIHVPPLVEISSDQLCLPGIQQQVDEPEEDRIHASPPTPTLANSEETRELQELIQLDNSKKKKKKRGFRAAARAIKFWGHRKKHDKLTVEAAALPTNQKLPNDEVSPTFTDTTASSEEALSLLNTSRKQDKELDNLQLQVHQQEECIQETQGEIQDLQSKLAASIAKYQAQLSDFQLTQKQLEQMMQQQQQQQPTPPAASEEPKLPRVFKRCESGSFMRVHDLDLSRKSSSLSSSSSEPSLSSLSQQSITQQQQQQPPIPTPEFLLIDQYLLEIVHQLLAVGFDLVCEEAPRYTPTRDTAKLISSANMERNRHGWPIAPWTAALNDQILIWTGKVSHTGFGHTWPIVKGRVVLHTSPKQVLEYLWDSSMVPRYNPHCQGRDDVYMLQDDVDMTAAESPFGFTGCAKIVRSLNKHRMLPKAIEMKALLYARPMEQHEGSYVLVSRSVWENGSSTLDKANHNVIRTEMLMGCTIIRKLDDNSCELTQMTHVHLPGVPEMLARRSAPGQCHGLLKTLQGHFPAP